ncbi:metallophosphoesterase [Leptobacterium flavescens]|uniref:Metallophosphoesterase n=1 Tax=Leptobacterium flavescens TaxID=472055 RepID=A0A6P0UNK0_9FLAO|nr:metallophosphoesterase [Leptobacterium flavescens]NER13478.1 metallophosphoesterase [Leptobacterium flavescens]
MRTKILFFSFLVITLFNLNGQESSNSNPAGTDNKDISKLNEGPYIFIEKDKLIEKGIVNGKVYSKELPLDSYKTDFTPEKSEYKGVEKVAVLSDIHGQYDLTIELFKNNGIIDAELNWNFGNGHLVIVGDIFDRGPKVNEMLWFLYKLEKQAEKENGKVHFLLGNHEYMVLLGDLRYLHKKYETLSKLLNISYDELYGPETVLGRWIRSRATVIKIGNDTFVHGGISSQFLSHGYDISEINMVMRNSIDRETNQLRASDLFKIYFGRSGPIWYRGYFTDNLEDTEISGILNRINSKHIIVGHCSNKEVVQLYDHKIYGVDSSLKGGEYGELLFIINQKEYYRATLDGKKIQFKNSKN